MDTLLKYIEASELAPLDNEDLQHIDGGFLPALIICGHLILSSGCVNAIAAAGVTAGVAIGIAIYSK